MIMQDWFDSAVLIDDFDVEIGFNLGLCLFEPRAPYLKRAEKCFITSFEAQEDIEGLIRYYKDIQCVVSNRELSFKQISEYYNLVIKICTHDPSLDIYIPYIDTLNEIEKILSALKNPLLDRKIHHAQSYGFLFEMHIYQGMLYIRDKDPDGEEIFSLAKLPLPNVCFSSEAAFERVKNIIGTVSAALNYNPWKKE